MSWFAVGDFEHNMKRVLCHAAGYATEAEAEARIEEIQAQQHKPHHVSYHTVEAVSWQDLEREGYNV
jgi:hypothetical protein